MSDLDRLKLTPSWSWPPEAATHIKQGLEGGDPEARLVATELAGDLVVMDDEMAAKLLAILAGNDPDEVRGNAAIALGPALEEAYELGFDDELDDSFDARVLSEARVDEIQRALRGIHDDERTSQHVRRMCLEASVRAPQPWHAEAITRAYAHGDPGWRLTAVFCMGRVTGFESNILAALDDSDLDLVVEAVNSAGLLELNAAAPRVLRLAADEALEPRVRHAAIEALATLEIDGADELLVYLTESPDEELAKRACESLEERRVFSEPPDSGY